MYRLRLVFVISVCVVLLVGSSLLSMGAGKSAHAATIYYANPGDNLQAKASVLLAGDSLLLNDGTYNVTGTTPGLRVVNIHGTAASHITIAAVNDGKAIIDGQNGSQGNYEPIFVTNSSYVDIQGLVARNSYGDVVDLFSGAGSGNGPDSNINVRRVTAYNAGNGNHHVFDVAFGGSNILVEDSAAWGSGRYMFSTYHSSYVTFRRDWAHWESITDPAVEPRSPFNVYGSNNVTLENDIGLNAIPTKADDNYYTSMWETTDDPTNFPDTGEKVLGSMFYNNCNGWTGPGGVNTQFINDYFETPSNANCPLYTTKPYGRGVDWGTTGAGSFSNAVFSNSTIGFNRQSGSGAPSIINSVFYKNGTGITNDPGHSYSDWFGNTSNGTTLVGTDKTSDPGYDTATYGRGAYLFIPPTSPLHAAGSGGADIGANILYEYVNGSLTSTHLWPWPMESRIMTERGLSVTYDSVGGGMFKTLAGVYPSIFSAAASSGTITAPFAVGSDSHGSYVAQTTQIAPCGTSGAGEADYTFTVSTAGNYSVGMTINAPDTASNSLCLNIDTQPTDDTMAWDVNVTGSGVYQNQLANWRGNGTPTANQYVPKVFTLSSGSHTLRIRGREANTRFSQVWVQTA